MEPGGGEAGGPVDGRVENPHDSLRLRSESGWGDDVTAGRQLHGVAHGGNLPRHDGDIRVSQGPTEEILRGGPSAIRLRFRRARGGARRVRTQPAPRHPTAV